jgi:hypothetical protein
MKRKVYFAVAFVDVALNSASCVVATVIVLIVTWINRAASSRLVQRRPLSVAVAVMIATVDGDAAAVPAIHVLVGVAASALVACVALPSAVALAALVITFFIASVRASAAATAEAVPFTVAAVSIAIVPVAVERLTVVLFVSVPAALLAQDARRRHPQQHREAEYDHVSCCRRVPRAMHRA